MNQAKSQTTLEFMLLVSAVLLFALIIFFGVADYALKSREEITAAQLRQIGGKIADESREIFYLGLFSQEIVSFDFPDNVKDMYALYYDKPSAHESYLIINYQNGMNVVNMTFLTEVPLTTASCTTAANCRPGIDCTICRFAPADYSTGRKDLKLECIAWGGGYAVNITRVYI